MPIQRNFHMIRIVTSFPVFAILLLIGMGIFVISATATTTVAASPDVPSPLKQFNLGILLDEIQCNDSKVLVESPTGKPACVMENTTYKLQERGWRAIPDSAVSDKPLTATNDVKDDDAGQATYETVNQKGHGHYHQSHMPFPLVDTSFQLDSGILAPNQPITVTYNKTFLVEPDDHESDSLSIVFHTPSQIAVEFSDTSSIRTHNITDRHTYAYLGDRGYRIALYHFEDHGLTFNNTVTLTLAGPLSTDENFMSIAIAGGDQIYYLLEQQEDGSINLIQKPEWDSDDYAQEYFEPYRIQHEEARKQTASRSDSSDQTNKYIERKWWSQIADFLREQHKQGNHLDWMTTGEFSDRFIKDFTAAYPDLRVQSSKSATGA